VLGAAALLCATTVLSRAEDGDPRSILKAMSDYMAGQGNLSVRYDADIEVITPDLQKIQFTASGDVLVDRQGGLRASRTFWRWERQRLPSRGAVKYRLPAMGS
jgi:hypothetical protein